MKVLENIEWVKSHHQSLTPFGKGKPTFENLEKMFYGKWKDWLSLHSHTLLHWNLQILHLYEEIW